MNRTLEIANSVVRLLQSVHASIPPGDSWRLSLQLAPNPDSEPFGEIAVEILRAGQIEDIIEFRTTDYNGYELTINESIEFVRRELPWLRPTR